MHNRQQLIKPPHNNHQTSQQTAALTATLSPIAQVRATDARAPTVVLLANVNFEDGVIVDMDSHDRPAIRAEANDSQSPRNGVR
jgi:hypothetical protein